MRRKVRSSFIIRVKLKRDQEVQPLLNDEQLRAIASSIESIPVGKQTFCVNKYAFTKQFVLNDIRQIAIYYQGICRLYPLILDVRRCLSFVIKTYSDSKFDKDNCKLVVVSVRAELKHSTLSSASHLPNDRSNLTFLMKFYQFLSNFTAICMWL